MPLFVARWAMGQFAAERDAYQATIRTLVQAVETKDAYTRGHSERVARASVMIARRLSMNEDRVNALEYAGTLHDVGKLGVPTGVLQKAGKLTDEEFDAIKTHPVRGHEIVRDIEFLDEALAGIYHHHERIDGRGYPDGLMGDRIPMTARILAVAETYDVLTSPDSYRIQMSAAEAEDELRRVAGTQLDGRLVWLFATQVLRGRHSEHVGHSADLETELQVQRRVRGVLDGPFVLGPPSR
jgi:HD-GYP domain-containing protein (c-di-GMP phosphodiesterase class II)